MQAFQFLIYTVAQEIKDLEAMLKAEPSATEKVLIRRTIDQLRRGDQQARVQAARIVGVRIRMLLRRRRKPLYTESRFSSFWLSPHTRKVTCAASSFPCLEGMLFPVLLLDECCQMTEPSALMPMARFGCQYLVLVGDPKQLGPTIATARENSSSLSQSMFSR